MDKKSSIPDCCGSASSCAEKVKYYEVPLKGQISTNAGSIPVVSSTLKQTDVIDAWKVRWKLNRAGYRIRPGLYAVGNPDNASPVLVTANYKLSFDSLRRELANVDCWILVLDTKGINVWCAAGKGTFGTQELIRQIKDTKLQSIVSHGKIILPQLGAPGVSAHLVTRETGFRVIYGPVRASDIPDFLAKDYQATPEMRKVNFTFRDRLVLVPVELVSSLKPMLIGISLIFFMTLLASYLTSDINTWQKGIALITAFVGAVIGGVVISPLLLPFIPFSSFAVKGWIVGMLWISGFVTFWPLTGTDLSLLTIVGLYLLLPPITAFLSLNFTGCTTYTSQSGVEKEMRYGLPIMIISSVLGLGALATQYFSMIFLGGV